MDQQSAKPIAALHRPVLLKESIESLVWDPRGLYVDATAGLGGHSRAIAQALQPPGGLLSIDMDPEMTELARARLGGLEIPPRLVCGNFKDIARILDENSFSPISGVLFDFGVSSYHLEQSRRGFSFQSEGPLDMRLNQSLPLRACDVVNCWPKEELARIFLQCSEGSRSGKLAEAIVRQRALKGFETTRELSALIERLSPRGRRHGATKVFMALRIAVNRELENIEAGLRGVAPFLAPGGRIAAISFHSLEDRIVKNVFKEMEATGLWKRAGKKPLTPSRQEVGENPRARSAKLRVIEKQA